MASPEWLSVRDVILSALMQYPDARAAVSGRLPELEAGPRVPPTTKAKNGDPFAAASSAPQAGRHTQRSPARGVGRSSNPVKGPAGRGIRRRQASSTQTQGTASVAESGGAFAAQCRHHSASWLTCYQTVCHEPTGPRPRPRPRGPRRRRRHGPGPLAIRGPGQRPSVDPAQLLPAVREVHNVCGEGRTV